jgi:hypothetical protein
MKLLHAIAEFERRHQPGASPSIALLGRYFGDASVNDVTEERLRDFLARWYVEELASPAAGNPPSAHETHDPAELCDRVSTFIGWCEAQFEFAEGEACRTLLGGLRSTLPRAFLISAEIQEWHKDRGGAFEFPEFLTSFEEGGRSSYDVGPDGEPSSLEGYFRILRVDSGQVLAEDLISDERVGPINLTRKVTKLLVPGYVLNLELVRRGECWEVINAGPVYPPAFRL